MFNSACDGVASVENIIDILSHNGGLHLYEKYLQEKDNPHCSSRLMQFFEEGIQKEVEVDHWATKIVKTKLVVKVENQIDDASSSARSKRAPSIASSRKTFKMRQIQTRKDSEVKSKLGDSMRERSDRKEIVNISIPNTTQNTNLNLIPLEVEPPREITEEERQLRDRKDKQLKMKELEMKELREKQERERLRLKNKQDAFAEIEKNEYTYDDTGKIIMVKRPNIQKLPASQENAPEFQLNQSSQQNLLKPEKVPLKSRTRLQSAKQPVQKELKVVRDSKKDETIAQEKAEQELQENYQKMFNQQLESLRDYGIQKDPLDVQAGIVMTDKEGRKLKGPPIDRENKMTLQEYQKIAAQFEVMSDEKLSRYGSAKKIQTQDNLASQLEYIQEDSQSIIKNNKKSPERIQRNYGAEEIYDREISYTQHKINMRARRKDLKSANVKTLNQKVIAQHNKEVRITSAKQQQDFRIRKTPSNLGNKERIFNYENHIGGIDFFQNNESSKMSNGRPLSSQTNNLLNKKQLHLAIGLPKQPSSLIDEFNKKLVEKGTSYPVLPSELPKGSQYLQKKQERPQTSKPIFKNATSRIQISQGQIHDALVQEMKSINENDQDNFLNTKSHIQKKGPRERIISAKLPREHDKLPPPPFGKTMGHGILLNRLK